MTQSTTSGRLQAYFTDKHLSTAQVARDTGIQYDTLQQILSGKVKAMGVDKFAAIWQAYPDLDGWHILTGQDVPPMGQLPAAAGQTLEELRSLKAEVVQVLDKRIQELGG